jgi:antitoxin (DNA-binding transcriptional repressor) of toxin-antitoxin stability system
MCHVTRMPSVNMRELRDTRRLKNWLRAGQTVELRERDRLIAHIVPKKTEQERPVSYPDFAACAREIFGNRVLNIVDDLIKDRGRF